MEKDELKIIGTKLYRLRKQAGLSRRQFAETYNFAESTIKLWELGQVEMGIIKLSKYLEIFQDFSIYIDLNTLVNTDGNSNNNFDLTLQKFQPISVFLENIGQGNTLFYVKCSGEIVYFNPQYKYILDSPKLQSDSFTPLYINNVFDDEYCKQILTKTKSKYIVNITKKLPKTILNLETELSPNIDIDHNVVGITGFLLSKSEKYLV